MMMFIMFCQKCCCYLNGNFNPEDETVIDFTCPECGCNVALEVFEEELNYLGLQSSPPS